VYVGIYRVTAEERSIVLEVIISVIVKKVHINMCQIPNGFRDI